MFDARRFADWQADMIGQGITWLRISFQFDPEKFPAGLPNVRVEKFGKEVWDPRDGTWKWSQNAALVILDYYRTWLNVPDDEIARRRAAWTAPPPRYTRGVQAKFAFNASSASRGAVLDDF